MIILPAGGPLNKSSARPRIRTPVHLLAFGFGAGLLPWAPGTFGTLVGIPVYAFIGNLYDRIDIVLLSRLAGNYATGVYSAAYRPLGTVQLVPYGVLYSLLPGLSRNAASGEDERRLERAMGPSPNGMAARGHHPGRNAPAPAGRAEDSNLPYRERRYSPRVSSRSRESLQRNPHRPKSLGVMQCRLQLSVITF